MKVNRRAFLAASSVGAILALVPDLAKALIHGSAGALNWTTVAPILTTTQLLQQGSGYSGSGSRIVYVSNAGNDANPGTQLLPVASVATAVGLIRDGFPDQLLFKCGDSWTGAGVDLHAKNGQTMSGTPGATITGPILVSYYGSGNRPLITVNSGNAAYTNFPSGQNGQNIAFIGLEFYNPLNDPANGAFTGGSNTTFGIFNDNLSTNFLVEDCKISFFVVGVNIANTVKAGNIYMRRNIIHDCYTSAGQGQGILIQSVNSIICQDNFLYRNGWNPSVAATLTNFSLIRSRNVYFQSDDPGDSLPNAGYNSATFTGNTSLYSASEGVQLRQGGTCYNNLFGQNTAQDMGHMTDTNHTPPGSPMSVTYNVIVNACDLQNSAGVRGTGFQLNDLPNGGTFQKNIICHGVSTTPSGQFAFELAQNHSTTTGCTVTGNITYNMGGAGTVGNGVQVDSPVTGNTTSPNAYESGNANTSGYQAAVTNTDLIGYVYGANLGGGTSTLAAYIIAVLAAKQPRQGWGLGYNAATINDNIRTIFNQAQVGH